MKYLKLFESYEEYYRYISYNEWFDMCGNAEIGSERGTNMTGSDFSIISKELKKIGFNYVYLSPPGNGMISPVGVNRIDVHARVDPKDKYPAGPKWLVISKLKDDYFLLYEFDKFVKEEDKNYIICDQLDGVLKWINDNIEHEEDFVKNKFPKMMNV
jgi:hypothetical protein